MKKKSLTGKTDFVYPVILIVIFILLITLSIPEGCLYGSTVDWYSQHVTLAETIRKACLEQKTLAPAWLSLGGGSNGYQFAYYGYFRPDILIGCLFPKVPMVIILPAYMLAGYLFSVLLLYRWLRDEGTEPFFSFLGGALFLTAVCFFQTHRQVMFINYMPFLILALMMIRKKKYAWVCICLFLIYVSSFYYAIACLAVTVWYWYRLEGKQFFRRCFVTVCFSVGMAMMLLLPSFLVILEHKHSGERAATIADLFMPNLQNLLYNPYGMGLTVLSLYLLLVGLGHKKYRKTSILFLLLTIFGAASWILNGTLYARAKILIPFVPLLMLHNISIFQEMHRGELRWRIWPFVLFVPAILSQWREQWFLWIVADTGIVFAVVLISKIVQEKNVQFGYKPLEIYRYLFLLVMPAIIFLRIAQEESWVEVLEQSAFSEEEIAQECGNSLYRCDNISGTLNAGNVLEFTGQQKTTMYSSVTNPGYQGVYYDLLFTPIQINNRTALLAEENPFLQNLMGVRYMITTQDKMPVGYEVIRQKGDAVIAENASVLPIAYTTSKCMGEQQFEALDALEKLEAVSKYTIVPECGEVFWDPERKDIFRETEGGKADSGSREADSEQEGSDSGFEISSIDLPDRVQIKEVENGYRLKVEEASTVTVKLKEPVQDILLLQFQVKNRTESAVVISANGIKNKLSGSTAPYPNGNNCFSYPFSGTEGISQLTFRLSKGSYDITDIQMSAFSSEIFSEKEVEPVVVQQEGKRGRHTVFSCRANAVQDGYFVTSIPMQRGMKLFVDGKETDIEIVNEAFVGASLNRGVHEIELRFFPPGRRTGSMVSLVSGIVFAGSCIWKKRRKQ